MGQAKGLIGILLVAAVVIASFSIFTVNEREKAILFRLGLSVTCLVPGAAPVQLRHTALRRWPLTSQAKNRRPGVWSA